MQRQKKGDLPLTLQNSDLYTFLSKKRVISFVFLDSAGVQRVEETCDNLEGKGGTVEPCQKTQELSSEMCPNLPRLPCF